MKRLFRVIESNSPRFIKIAHKVTDLSCVMIELRVGNVLLIYFQKSIISRHKIVNSLGGFLLFRAGIALLISCCLSRIFPAKCKLLFIV